MIEVGVNLIPVAPVSRIVVLGKEAERLGFSRFWTMDEGLATRDVFITLSAVARETKNILLGTGITNPYARHPGLTAVSIATLDEYSGGRAMLGLGAGGSLTLDPLAIARHKPVTAVREMITTLRAIFRGETVSLEGEIVHFHNAHIEYINRDIPIWVAGRGEQMLTLGGEMADGVSLDFIHCDQIGEYADIIRKGASGTGNQPRIQYATMIITNDRQLERLRPFVTFSLVDSPQKVKQLIGISPEEVELIRQVMVRDGLHAAGKLLKEKWVSPFVVMGSVPECAEQIKRLQQKFGIDDFMLPIMDLDSAHEMMENMAAVKALL